MFVCKCELHLYLLSDPRSLKEKRMVIRSLKDKVRNRFPVAIAEVGDENIWNSAIIGIASVSNTNREASSAISKIISFIEQNPELEIAACHTEIV